MKAASLGTVSGLLLVASAAAHGLLGWPQFVPILEMAGVDGQVVGALAIGWYFGSVAMLGFGALVLHQTLRRFRGQSVQVGPLWIVSILYLVYGMATFLSSELNPHFLVFVVTGVLVGLFAVACQAGDDSLEFEE